MAREKALDNKVLSFLKEQNAWVIKYWAGAKYTKEGVPDILACINGKFFGIEDKAENGRPKMLQLKNLQWIREAGGYGILLYPKDFESFKMFVINSKTDPLDNDQYSYLAEQWYLQNIELQKEWYDKLNKI